MLFIILALAVNAALMSNIFLKAYFIKNKIVQSTNSQSLNVVIRLLDCKCDCEIVGNKCLSRGWKNGLNLKVKHVVPV